MIEERISTKTTVERIHNAYDIREILCKKHRLTRDCWMAVPRRSRIFISVFLMHCCNGSLQKLRLDKWRVLISLRPEKMRSNYWCADIIIWIIVRRNHTVGIGIDVLNSTYDIRENNLNNKMYVPTVNFQYRATDMRYVLGTYGKRCSMSLGHASYGVFLGTCSGRGAPEMRSARENSVDIEGLQFST